MNPQPSILKQTILTFFGQTGGFVVGVLTGILVARHLGPAGKGVIALCALFLAVFTTYGDGMQSAIMYQFSRHRGNEDGIYAASLRLIGAVLVPLSIVVFAVGLAVPRFAGLTFVACALPFAIYLQVASAFFLARNEVSTTIVTGGINTFGYAAVVTPAILIWHAGTDTVLGIWAAMYVIAGCYAFFRMSSIVPAAAAKTTTPAILFEQARFALKSGSVSVASFLNLRVDIFVVGLMLDARALGIYSLAVATVEMMWQLTRPLGWTTIGRIAVAERATAITLAATVTRNILAISLIGGTVFFIFAPAAITFVYGSAYAMSGHVARWLIPGIVLYAANGTLGYYVMVREGKPVLMFVVQAGSAIACAAITAATIHQIGIYGAALATSVTYAFATVAKAVAFNWTTGTSPVDFLVLRSEDFERYRRIVGHVSESQLRAVFVRRA